MMCGEKDQKHEDRPIVQLASRNVGFWRHNTLKTRKYLIWRKLTNYFFSIHPWNSLIIKGNQMPDIHCSTSLSSLIRDCEGDKMWHFVGHFWVRFCIWGSHFHNSRFSRKVATRNRNKRWVVRIRPCVLPKTTHKTLHVSIEKLTHRLTDAFKKINISSLQRDKMLRE